MSCFDTSAATSSNRSSASDGDRWDSRFASSWRAATSAEIFATTRSWGAVPPAADARVLALLPPADLVGFGESPAFLAASAAACSSDRATASSMTFLAAADSC